jgi:hypothetical protein
MIVECVALINPDGHKLDRSAWLTIGKRYLVLEVSASGNGQDFIFRVMSDNGRTPIVVSLEEVTIVSGEIPAGWVGVASGGRLKIGPEVFMEPGFWENYFNNNVAAVRTFDEIWEGLRDLRKEIDTGGAHTVIQ